MKTTAHRQPVSQFLQMKTDIKATAKMTKLNQVHESGNHHSIDSCATKGDNMMVSTAPLKSSDMLALYK